MPTTGHSAIIDSSHHPHPKTSPTCVGAAAKVFWSGTGKLPWPTKLYALPASKQYPVLLVHHMCSKGRNDIKDSKASIIFCAQTFTQYKVKTCILGPLPPPPAQPKKEKIC